MTIATAMQRLLMRVLGGLFAGNSAKEAVATGIRFRASPEVVWNHIMFYEEVPHRPALLLRLLLPSPIRTDGDKSHVGATVRCIYEGGDLVKRITGIDAPHLLQFEVIEQRLGIERCLLTYGGSYRIEARADDSEVVLVTDYDAYLRPRRLWRPLEKLLLRHLHLHILRGIGAELTPRPSQGALAWTATRSPSRR